MIVKLQSLGSYAFKKYFDYCNKLIYRIQSYDEKVPKNQKCLKFNVNFSSRVSGIEYLRPPPS